MPRESKRRLAPEEFAALEPLLTLSRRRIAAARLAMVIGQSHASIALMHDCTRQAVTDTVAVVWAMHGRLMASRKASSAAVTGTRNVGGKGKNAYGHR